MEILRIRFVYRLRSNEGSIQLMTTAKILEIVSVEISADYFSLVGRVLQPAESRIQSYFRSNKLQLFGSRIDLAASQKLNEAVSFVFSFRLTIKFPKIPG